MTAPLDADQAELKRFVEVLFRHAEGGFVSLRTFDHDPGEPPIDIRPVEINGAGLSPVIAQATGAANRAARHERPCVFCPPVCTFKTAKGASDADVHEGVALSIDCDERPSEARQRLTGILGHPTVVVASGGLWTNLETGEFQPKFHLHWVLAEPTRDPEGHAKLKRARRLCVALVGGDASVVPLVHPLRWPGSWHRKGKAKLCRGVDYRPSAEIDLDEALERLEGAATLALEHATGREAERLQRALNGGTKVVNATLVARDPDARDPDLEALADAIPNEDEPRDVWQNVGLRFYAASEGSAAGFNAFDRWSRKSSKYHGGTVKRWSGMDASPPTETGKAALVRQAQRANPALWLPSWGPVREPPAPEVAKVEARELPGPAPEGAKPFAAWTFDDMLNLEPPRWVVEDVLQLGTRGLLFSPSGHHKTNLTVDLVCHAAHGLDWHGHKVETAFPMIIVATEDAHGAAMRVVGWHDSHDLAGGRVLVVPGGELRLNDPASVAQLKATAEQHFPGERVGFAIDHYDVSIEGDPTNTEEAKGAAEGLREIGRDAAFVLLLAHCPWTTDGRAKVPVTLWANVDARFRCERDEVTGQATLTLMHQKNGRSGGVLKFEFEEHSFATRLGEASCLIARRLADDPMDFNPPQKKGPRLSDLQRITLQCLSTAICDHGEDAPLAPDIPLKTRVARFERWREVTLRHSGGKAKEEWRRNYDFKRIAEALQARGMVKIVDDLCWPTSAGAQFADNLRAKTKGEVA